MTLVYSNIESDHHTSCDSMNVTDSELIQKLLAAYRQKPSTNETTIKQQQQQQQQHNYCSSECNTPDINVQQQQTSQAPKIRRRQVKKACSGCQKAHAACSFQRPCSRCIQRGEADQCVDAPRKYKKKPVTMDIVGGHPFGCKEHSNSPCKPAGVPQKRRKLNNELPPSDTDEESHTPPVHPCSVYIPPIVHLPVTTTVTSAEEEEELVFSQLFDTNLFSTTTTTTTSSFSNNNNNNNNTSNNSSNLEANDLILQEAFKGIDEFSLDGLNNSSEWLQFLNEEILPVQENTHQQQHQQQQQSTSPTFFEEPKRQSARKTSAASLAMHQKIVNQNLFGTNPNIKNKNHGYNDTDDTLVATQRKTSFFSPEEQGWDQVFHPYPTTSTYDDDYYQQQQQQHFIHYRPSSQSHFNKYNNNNNNNVNSNIFQNHLDLFSTPLFQTDKQQLF